MFYNNCSGCLQVPVPVHYWSPYIVPSKKSSFHIADILRHHMTNSIQNQDLSRQSVHSDVKRANDNNISRSSGQEYVSIKRFRHSQTSQSANVETSKPRQTDAVECSLPSALAPLQALCSADVTSYSTPSRNVQKSHSERTDSNSSLKFGINRILSEDFGKGSTEKENNPEQTDFQERSCDCSDYHHVAYSTYALSAVHALQPPRYPHSPTDSDILPGPYSVLNTDVTGGHHNKRKRSWSRAVFSNLQRKGLEKRFEVQKYVTKPDRRQLAAMLGLTDAQVKVWFQNRRMKWRHTNQQQKQSDDEKDTSNDSRDDELDSNATAENSAEIGERNSC